VAANAQPDGGLKATESVVLLRVPLVVPMNV
jgi:hypothetical protein